MKRDPSKAPPETSLDELFASVAGIVRIAARRYFLRWMRREGRPRALPPASVPATDAEEKEAARC